MAAILEQLRCSTFGEGADRRPHACQPGGRRKWTVGEQLGELKHRWRDGMEAFGFEPEELVARLATLVPPPLLHLV